MRLKHLPPQLQAILRARILARAQARKGPFRDVVLPGNQYNTTQAEDAARMRAHAALKGVDGLGGVDGFGKSFKRAVKKVARPVQHVVKQVIPKPIQKLAQSKAGQLVGATLMPIAAAPGLVDKSFRKTTTPVYLTYGAAALAAGGAAAAGAFAPGAAAVAPAAGAGTAAVAPAAPALITAGAGTVAALTGGGGGGSATLPPPEAEAPPQEDAPPDESPSLLKPLGIGLAALVGGWLLLKK